MMFSSLSISQQIKSFWAGGIIHGSSKNVHEVATYIIQTSTSETGCLSSQISGGMSGHKPNPFVGLEEDMKYL